LRRARKLFAARAITTSHSLRSSALPAHLYEDSNPTDAPFVFTPENETEANRILSFYPLKRAAMLPLLLLAQKQNDNWLPISAMNEVAKLCDVPPILVYEVATFYTMYHRTKKGKYNIEICGTTPCMIKGAREIMHVCEEHLGIKMGQTTADGMFTLEEVECLGACVNAPMIQVNAELPYEDLTPERTVTILEGLRAGTPPKHGPQPGMYGDARRAAENSTGRTCLTEEPWGPAQLEEQMKASGNF